MAAPALNVIAPTEFADARAVAQALQPEEPVFCFSARRLTDTLRRFMGGFPGTVSYAVKSNRRLR